MPGPFIAHHVNGRLHFGLQHGKSRQALTCRLCGTVGTDLPVGGCSEQWALGHLQRIHPVVFATRRFNLGSGELFEIRPWPGAR